MLLCLLFVHVSNSRPVVYKSQERIFKRTNRDTKTLFLFGKARSLRYGKALTSSPIPIRSVSLFHSNNSRQAQTKSPLFRRKDRSRYGWRVRTSRLLKAAHTNRAKIFAWVRP